MAQRLDPWRTTLNSQLFQQTQQGDPLTGGSLHLKVYSMDLSVSVPERSQNRCNAVELHRSLQDFPYSSHFALPLVLCCPHLALRYFWLTTRRA